MANLRFISENEYDACNTFSYSWNRTTDVGGNYLAAPNLQLISKSTIMHAPDADVDLRNWLGFGGQTRDQSTGISANGFSFSRHNLTDSGGVRLILFSEIPNAINGYGNPVVSNTPGDSAITMDNIPTEATEVAWNGFGYSFGDAGDVRYDSGMVDASTISGWGAEPWGHFPWGGVIGSVNGNPLSQSMVYWFTNNSGLAIGGVKYFVIIMTDPGRNIELSRIFLGSYTSPTYNLSNGHSLLIQDKSKQFRTDGGTLRSDVSHLYKIIKFKLGLIAPDEYHTFLELFARTGKRKDMLISVFPEAGSFTESDYIMVGKLNKIPEMKEVIGGYYRISSFQIEEV